MKAVFLDRDGTLIEDRDYLRNPDEAVLIPGAAAALRRCMDAGYELFLVTNQSGVGRGYFTMEDVQAVHARLAELLAPESAVFREIYVAPEAPGQPSRGRKPSPQFLFDARDQFGVDLGASVMIGDKWSDIECGRRAGVGRIFLVRTGYGAEVERRHAADMDGVAAADSLPEAVSILLEDASP